ncbi:MAG: hypothetical protein L0Y54_22450 [Sporichthyaceae bacterium]|nr:hypothetical protein [Sporichthyaceae bacterium]
MSTARFRRAAAVLGLSLCAAAAGAPNGGLRALVLSESLLPKASASTAYPFNPWSTPVHPPVPGPLPLPPTPPVTPTPVTVPTGPGIPTYPTYPGYQFGIPANVLAAYQRASTTMRARDSDCHLSWPILAGIGKIESGHARGGDLYANGNSRTRIIGIALDGSRPGTATISDSDNGRWDGDSRWDHAVGPMQFLPGTWRSFGQNGNSDGVRDPHNMYDAALAAATYLCAGGRDLATFSGLRAALLAYNPSDSYVQAVLAWISVYRSSGVPVPPMPGPSTSSPRPTPTRTASSTPTPTSTPTSTPSNLKPTGQPTGVPSEWPTPTTTPTPTGPDCPTSTPTETSTPTATPSPTGTGCPTSPPTCPVEPVPSEPADTAAPSAVPTGSAVPPEEPTGPPSPTDGPTGAPTCPAPSEPAEPAESAVASDAPTNAPSDASTGSSATSPEPASSQPEPAPSDDDNPLAREENPAATAPASAVAESGRQAPTPTAPPDPTEPTAEMRVATLGTGSTETTEQVGTVTVDWSGDHWQVSVDHLRGFGGSVRYLDQLAPRINDSIAAQYGAAADRSVALVAVLDQPVVAALREVRATAAEPTAQRAVAARVAFGRVAAAAGLSGRDVAYLIATVE